MQNITGNSEDKKNKGKKQEKARRIAKKAKINFMARTINKTVRCSLKQLFTCVEILKERHIRRLRDAGLGPLLDSKIRQNINIRLACFLMNRIDPATMTLNLGVANKVIEITSYAIHLLFGLPDGSNTAPRPSESGNDKTLHELKIELGFRKNEDINTDDLRKVLTLLVKDEANDDLALKVFVLIMYMKFICPGTAVRVSREAAMVKNLDISKLKDMDLCQLLVDELKRAVIQYRKSKSKWTALPGCIIAPVLLYLDCCMKQDLSDLDKRTPRTHFMDYEKLRSIAAADCAKKGGEDPNTWIFGNLPVREFQ
jgi:hypothetical protein